MDEQAHRVLPVQVDAWTVMDMNGPECSRGETVEVILEFREEDAPVAPVAPVAPGTEEAGTVDPADLPDLTDMVVTVDAWAPGRSTARASGRTRRAWCRHGAAWSGSGR